VPHGGWADLIPGAQWYIADAPHDGLERALAWMPPKEGPYAEIYGERER
jgi:hypothetical protein